MRIFKRLRWPWVSRGRWRQMQQLAMDRGEMIVQLNGRGMKLERELEKYRLSGAGRKRSSGQWRGGQAAFAGMSVNPVRWGLFEV